MRNFKVQSLVFLFGILMASMALSGGRIQNEDVKSSADIRSAALTTTGNLTISNACISSIGSTANLATGLFIYDTTTPGNINSGTTIAGLPGTCAAGQVQMSTTANNSATGDTITFGGQDSQLVNDSKIWVTANSINSTLSSAITSGLIGGSGGGGVNLLSGSDNSGFEQGTSQWTASGGIFTATSTNPIFGSKSALWTASASGQTVYSNLKSLTSFIGLQGASCMGAIKYFYAGANGDYSLVVSDGTNILASASLNTTPTNSQDANVTFTCPTTGSLEVGILSNVSSPGAIKWDGSTPNGGQVLLGSNSLVTNLSQANIYGTLTFASTGSCDTSESGSSLTSFSDTTCTTTATGNVQAFGSTTPGFQLPNAPPGDYYVVLNGGTRVDCQTGTSNCAGLFAFTDGTTTTNPVIVRIADGSGSTMDFSGPPIVGHFTYTTSGTRSINLQGALTAGSGGGNHVEFIAITNSSNSNFSNAQFMVYYFPTSSQQAINVATTPLSWQGYVPQSCQWQQNAAASHAYQDFPSIATSCQLVQTVNNNFGSVVSQRSGGNYLPGIVWTPTQTGTYQICANTNGWDATATTSMSLSLEDTNGTIINRTSSATGGAGHAQNFTLCGQYVVPNLNQVTIKITGASDGSGDLLVLAEGATNLRSIDWSIMNITQNLPMPVLIPTQGFALVKDIKSAGTDGGSSSSGGWFARTLNTLETQPGVSYISLSSNQFTLNNAGTYLIEANSPIRCGRNQIKVRNVSDSTDAIIGSSEEATDCTVVAQDTRSVASGIVTITGSKTFEIDYQTATAQGTNGLGRAANFGVNEVYTIVKVQKIQ